ncbi:ethylene-responsive transcription factor ERF020-like [Curcuma longa]|uniref:ethylene-responsive transcription factor ERF020-like n=1 Tax=Curcuma longa TaxID=136217 RepID=UPI003D9E7276
MNPPTGERKYKGARRRRWGKWVSEIRVPGTRERLWLGSYSTPEAAAVAHDTAVFFLHGPGAPCGLNFPDCVAGLAWASLSPTSVQRVASEAGMDVDAQLAVLTSPQAAAAARLVAPVEPEMLDEARREEVSGSRIGRQTEEIIGDACLDTLILHILD